MVFFCLENDGKKGNTMEIRNCLGIFLRYYALGDPSPEKYDHTKSNKTTPNLGGGGVLLGICDHPKSPKGKILKASFTGNVTQIEKN